MAAGQVPSLVKEVCFIEKNLSALKTLPRVALHNIRDIDGANKKKQRVGRGPGSGRGKTCGRGHKGQGQRGPKPRLGFEGGQFPFYLRVPKRGFRNRNQKFYEPMNLNKLQYFIDSGRIDPNEKITMPVLQRAGAVAKIRNGVKLLGSGAENFKSKVDIELSQASASAIQAVEKQGGTVKSVYYNRLGLQVLLKPEKYQEPQTRPRQARPDIKQMIYYTNPKKRGFLANPEEVEKLREQNRKKAEVVTKMLENTKI